MGFASGATRRRACVYRGFSFKLCFMPRGINPAAITRREFHVCLRRVVRRDDDEIGMPISNRRNRQDPKSVLGEDVLSNLGRLGAGRGAYFIVPERRSMQIESIRQGR